MTEGLEITRYSRQFEPSWSLQIRNAWGPQRLSTSLILTPGSLRCYLVNSSTIPPVECLISIISTRSGAQP